MTMNPHLPSVFLTARDHRRLTQTAECLAEQGHPLAKPLLHELGRATLCGPGGLPDDVVALDTFVTYQLSCEEKPERRMLIHPDDRMWPPVEMSVLTPVGLSLLGLRVGDRMPVLGSAEPHDNVWVEAVGPRVVGSLAPLRSM